MKHYPFRLRASIPVVLLLFGTALTGLAYYQGIIRAYTYLENHKIQRATTQGNTISLMLECLCRKGDMEGANQLISQNGADPMLSLAVFCDDKNKVLLSTAYALRDLPVADTPAAPTLPLFERVRRTMSGAVEVLKDGKAVVAVFPVVLGEEPNSIRPSRTGVLYLKYDLSRLKSEACRQALWESLEMVLIVLGLCILVWLCFRFTITQRVARLVEATHRLARGEFDVRSGLTGKDELAQISRAFDQMASDVQKYAEALKSANELIESRVRERTADIERANEQLRQEVAHRQETDRMRALMVDRQQQINHLQGTLLAPGALGDKLAKITQGVVEIFGADFCRIWLTKPGDLCERGCVHAEVTEGPHVCRYRDRCLHLMASAGRYTHTDGKIHRRVPFGCYKIGRVAADLEPKFLTNDVTNDPRVHDHKWTRELGLVSFAGYQLRPPGMETVGVLALFAKHAITPEEDALIESLSTTTAQVIQTAGIEEALVQSEERFRSMSHSAQDAIIMMDNSGSISFWNPAAERIFGYSNQEAMGKNLHDLLAPDALLAAHKKGFAGFQASGKGDAVGKTSELTGRRKDGAEFPVELSLSTVQIKGRWHAIGIVRDVTERKKAEEQLKRYAADLEHANEEVKQFAYIVSHDLRAPLVNLKGFSGELKSALKVVDSSLSAALPDLSSEQEAAAVKAMREDVPEALAFIDASVTRMDGFTNALLKLSRLGRREIKPESVNMDSLVREALKGLAHQLESRQTKVSIGTLPDVLADRTCMEQVMGNILGNAVKYLEPDRPGEIEVTGERTNTEVLFRVRDNGRGIAPEDMPKVFAPFRRAGRQDVPGEGMGLAYAQAMVRRHGGRIWCESEPGKGTTFVFAVSEQFVKDTYHAQDAGSQHSSGGGRPGPRETDREELAPFERSE